MTKFNAHIDGTPMYGDDPLDSNDAEEVQIRTRYSTYTLWMDGEDLCVLLDRDFKSFHLDTLRQLRLETS